MAEAAKNQIGVSLQAGGIYNWTPITLQQAYNTPTFIDGNGAIINLVEVMGAEAFLKFSSPMNWSDRDRFFIKDLTLNVNKRASHGIMLQAGGNLWLRRVKIQDASLAGIHSEGRPGAGAYYNAFRDCTITNAPFGVDILTTTNEKYTNANLVENLTTRDVETVYALSWTASTQMINTNAAWTSGTNGKKLMLNANFTSDVDLQGVKITGVPASPSMYTKSGWSVGLYVDGTRI